MIQHHGWRSAYLFLGCIALLGIPLTAALVRDRPERPVLHADNSTESGATVAVALRAPVFWIFAAITILSAFSENGLVTNLTAVLAQRGVLASNAALILSMRGGAGILGRLCVGYALDRFSARRIQTFVLALTAIGTLILAFADTGVTAAVGATALGVGLGSEADVMPYLLARYFGRRNFSALYGLTWTAYAIGGATGPLWMGHMYDSAGGIYKSDFVVFLAAIASGATVLSLFLPRVMNVSEPEMAMTASSC